MSESRALMGGSHSVALVPTQEEVQASMAVAKAMFDSGYWQDVKSVAQAYVKVQAGREWGIPPFSAMSAVHIIQGKPTMAANAIASKIKSSGKYDYRVKELTNQGCTIEFFEGGKVVGTETFTVKDAATAGLTESKMWAKYPKNMCFARAISNGARFYCADIFGGAVVYTPEEMGASVNPETGEVVSLPAASVRVVEPEPTAIEKAFPEEPTVGQADDEDPTVEYEYDGETYEVPGSVSVLSHVEVGAYLGYRAGIRKAKSLQELANAFAAVNSANKKGTISADALTALVIEKDTRKAQLQNPEQLPF